MVAYPYIDGYIFGISLYGPSSFQAKRYQISPSKPQQSRARSRTKHSWSGRCHFLVGHRTSGPEILRFLAVRWHPRSISVLIPISASFLLCYTVASCPWSNSANNCCVVSWIPRLRGEEQKERKEKRDVDYWVERAFWVLCSLNGWRSHSGNRWNRSHCHCDRSVVLSRASYHRRARKGWVGIKEGVHHRSIS